MTITPPRDRSVQPGIVRIILVLGALVALGPLTVDMYLPALPTIAGDLETTDPLVQLTLTGTLLGLGLGQLVVGPLSDAVGRRRPLLAGIGLHVATSLASALAWDITVFGTLRVLQGVGAAAATVVAMAVVRDLFEGRAAATALSRLMLVMGAAPVLAPSLGGLVLLAGSWRWVFGALAVLGVALMVMAAVSLPETLPAGRRRAGVGRTLGAYRTILGDRRFVLLALVTGLSFGAMFSYVSGSSFVLQEQFGLDQQQFGIVFGVCAAALIGGAQLNPALLNRYAPQRIAGVALAAVVVAGLAGIALQTTGIGGIAGFVVPVLVMLGGGSLVVPNTTALAMSRHGEAAGTAAAVVGAVQFGLGALVAPVVGLLGNDGAATVMSMTGAAVLACLALAAARERRRDASATAPITVPSTVVEHADA
ncbi:multidrug effflux MFS transporter [Thermomonospora cellulosilytica]|uniref:DHA1 family bicyclomycin/chloramphenicol resistance-like MFS transporter n=1 Tax=Thermomonospora cellulosilytica TaxID=1411118 RepID=A0A7W3MWC6_9ACTN|nr:multidrug effflux MFS transporter [Thermomonospora cellulosilytica]MBA9003007.1 DHA1 family bicyclomycin/chloramphenicol resistance-like MFS transporter [Thermomonospora cellulosilytica]